MDKQKEIEEIQKVIEYCCNVYDENNRHIRNKCNTYDCEYYDETNGVCCSFGLKEATALYNVGYRKIDKDSVVLSREEYERLKSIEIAFEEFAKPDGILIPIEEYQKDFSSQFNKGYEKACKEFLLTCSGCHWEKDYKILKRHEEEVIKLCEQEVKQASKETAEKFAKELLSRKQLIDLGCGDGTYDFVDTDDVVEVAKDLFGVEIKE